MHDAAGDPPWTDSSLPDTGEDASSDVKAEAAEDAHAGTDGAGKDAAKEAAAPGAVLVSIDHGSSPPRLLSISTATGAGKEICKLPAASAGAMHGSATFGRDGALYAYDSAGSRVDVVNPCSCETFVLGAPSAALAAMTVDEGDNLFGFEAAQDRLVRVSTLDGTSKPVGSLGLDISIASAAWSPALGRPYVFDGSTGRLHTVDPVGGAVAMPGVQVQGMSGAIGLESLPANGALFGCGQENVLVAIDPASGAVTKIGTGTGHQGACDNLAAPPMKISCLL